MNETNKLIDQAVSVRQGEELDLGALSGYLSSQIPGLDDAELEVMQFPSGHSNLTYLLRIGKSELVLRRPPFGRKIISAHDMQREYHVLSRLHPVYPKAPRPLLYCEDEHVLGAPFYVMEKLQGVILRGAQPAGRELSPAIMHKLSENFVDNLVELHHIDYRTAGLADLGHPQGYVRRQVEGWTQRYMNARTDDVPAMLKVAGWLAEHMPPENPPALIHNDYKFDNLVLDPADLSHITGVLDWEMATIGDPLMDLGTSLGYWVDPEDPPEVKMLSFGPTMLPGALNRRQIAERYSMKSDRDLTHLTFYYVYALFKIAVIVQQIYARYKAGYSQDERFAQIIFAVYVLSSAAERVIEGGGEGLRIG